MDKGNTMITLDELMNEVKTYIQEPDSLALIERAYRYAQEHHQGQFRRSGEPYMIHAARSARGFCTTCWRTAAFQPSR